MVEPESNVVESAVVVGLDVMVATVPVAWAPVPLMEETLQDELSLNGIGK
jgi:hypothetical protein